MSAMSEFDMRLRETRLPSDERKLIKQIAPERANNNEVLPRYAQVLGGEIVDSVTIRCRPGAAITVNVRLDPSAPDGFKVYAARYDDPAISYGALTAARHHCLELIAAAKTKLSDPDRFTAAVFVESDEQKIANARRIWDTSTAKLTLAREYLGGRGITDIAPYEERVIKVKYGPSRFVMRSEKPDMMVCAMRDVRTDQITAVHRTYFDDDWRPIIGEDGKKMRRSYGVMNRPLAVPPIHSAIKFSTHQEVFDARALVIGEGVETCLSAIELGFWRMWAMGSTACIASLPVIDGIDELVILGERDNGASRRAIKSCLRTWGKRASVVLPQQGFKDFNDQQNGVSS